MAGKIEIKSISVLSNNFFPLKKVDYLIENREGITEEVSREVYQSKNGATVLLYNKESDKIILTRQFRMPTFLNENESGMMIEACAGIVEDDEKPEDAIMREIEEETGFKVDKVVKIFELYSTPGSVSERLSYFTAEYLHKQKIGKGGGMDEESEDIEVIELSFEDAYLKLQSGEIKDAKTVILLQYARLYLFQPEKVFEIL